MNELLKILLIEDNINDCEIELDILKKSGLQFESVVVMNEEQYLQQLDQFQPDVILADYTLPQFNATDALNILHQRSLHLPFILVTGTVSEEFAAGIIKLGADDYILKSSLTRLPSAIESSLQKKKAEQALHLEQERNEFKARLLAKVGQAIIATTIDGAITYWNNAAEKIYGWSADEVMDRNIVDITSVDQSKTQANEIMKDLKAGKSWTGELYARRKDGSIFPILVTDSPVLDEQGSLTCIIGVSTDISARKKVEQELKEMENQILSQKIQEQKKITRAILNAQEQERNYMGGELHDNINQLLAGTKLYLGMVLKRKEDAEELIKYSVHLVDTAINEIRLLSRKHVTPLKNVNLKQLLDGLVANLNTTTRIQTVLEYNTVKPLGDDLKLTIYRIIQEQLNNIVKHADAKHAKIKIADSKNCIALEIVDSGKGFDTSKERKGIGISNMINRVESFNGEINIKSSPGNGCIITVTFPYQNNEGELTATSLVTTVAGIEN